MPIYSEERALWLMRNKGLEEYKSYLRMFDPPEEETNIPKLQIFRCNEEKHESHPFCCPVVIESIKACNYDNKKKDGKPAEDVAEFEGDDPYDVIRYACDAADKFISEASKEFEKVKREAAIIDKLKQTQDFTAYYRNMRTLESASIQGPIKMFRRRR
jgi:hypothetical protein